MSALRQPDTHRPRRARAASRRYQSPGYRAKRLLLGPALTTSELTHVPTYVYVLSVGGDDPGRRLAASDRRPGADHLHARAGRPAPPRGRGRGRDRVPDPARLRLGTTALTGVEAISNGVSAFRAPEAVNAKKTLMVMAAIMGALFLDITYLAVRLEALP